eukprot:TRINITY_DN4565_c0_g1_i2.p1 TRINITY_DN4565_c0_g1~~TRINITY_DN4565_c0_g1_i2.p1  ORF type:complete len:650 (+),score=179.85 TRINITY_DN4565_c0_g1_i2:37-1986(+)
MAQTRDEDPLKRTDSHSGFSYHSSDGEGISDVDSGVSLSSEEEKIVFEQLLKEIPVVWCVVKLMDKNDMMSFVIKAANPAYEVSLKKPLDQVIGKPYTEIHPFLLANDSFLLKENYKTATTGKSYDMPEVTVEDDIVGKAVVRAKYISLPNLCVLIVVERLDDPETVKKRRQEARRKLEDIMDRSLDTMLNPPMEGQTKEDSMESQVLRNVLAFGDISDADILISDQESLITAADIGTLIQNLSQAKDDFIEQFLITYRYFITPKSLLNKLILKYVSSKGDERGRETRERLTKVFRAWIKDHYYDFDVDPELLTSLNNFVHEHALHLKKLLEKQNSLSFPVGMEFGMGMKNQRSNSRILNLFKRKSTLTCFDATLVAHQLTLLSFQRFKNIKPLELHSQSWSKEKKNLTSPNVVALVNHFNSISNLFACEILSQQNLKKRVEALKHVINIGWAAFGYRDYETTFNVVLSLGMLPICRLTETWNALSSTSRQQWDQMLQFCDHKDNYKMYRSHLRKQVNMMPYMGLFLKDLTNIDENDTITSIGAVNFFKMRKVAQVIKTMQRAQQSIFNFQRNLKIVSYISFEVPLCDENELWEMSLQCEKENSAERNSQSKRLVDILSPTPLVTTSSNPIFGMTSPKSPLGKSSSTQY